jgi:hypothetical protein
LAFIFRARDVLDHLHDPRAGPGWPLCSSSIDIAVIGP